MADAEARIDINIDASEALAQIKNLQRQISLFHTEMAKGSAKAQTSAASLQKDLLNNINATRQFSASIVKVQTSAESFTNALEKNKLSLREYFRFGVAASGKFSDRFSAELETINKTARERVKDLQSQYIELGRNANGAMQAIKIRPQILDLEDFGTKTQMAAQRQQIFNQLLNQGSTNLLNFGKNTQWAGRQLMVGFTIPLSIFGTQASRIFMDLEKQAIKFRRVYGDLFTPPEETEATLKALQDLATEFTRYGVAVADTMGLAADAAAMGQQGAALVAQVSEATRLAVLGNIDQAAALETTISVTNAFGIAAEDLASKIDFLNAVENQTVTSIEDLTIAIPKAAPVVKQLGGDVEDLAFLLTAMKEGGINASEGANALKSGLASIINPTQKTTEFLKQFNISVQDIVESNAGDLKGTIFDIADALNGLDPLNRARAIEQLFGKFQFSRISTLFQNVVAEGTQAQRVLELANSTSAELASLSQRELGSVAESTTFRFEAAIERLKKAIAPIGEQFLKAVTPLIEGATKILESFNNLNDGVKNFVVIGGALLAGLGPIFLMTFGLVANGVANIIKGFIAVRNWFQKTKDSSTILGEQLEYMTLEQLNAAAAAASLERTHATLEQRFTTEAAAAERLIRVYQKAIKVQSQFPAGRAAAQAAGVAKGFASGGIIRGPGSGTSDSIIARVSNGEAIIPAEAVKENPEIVKGLIAGNIPGFAEGGLVNLFGEYALRLQDKSENMARRSGTTGSFEQVLAPLSMRVGEARGVTPSQARVNRGDFDDIAKEFESITKRFTDQLNLEFDTTFKEIKDENERYSKAWRAAGRSVESEVNKIASDADRGVVRKVFGLDEDVYGTMPTEPRRAGGTRLERARKSAFKGGPRSYLTAGAGAKALFERRTGTSAAEFQMGHVEPPRPTELNKILSDPNVSNAAKRAGERIGIKVSGDIVDGANKAAESASPSRKAKQAGKNISDGAIQGVSSGIDDAAQAGKVIGETVAKNATQAGIYKIGGAGSRRVTTDRNLAVQSASRLFSPSNNATGIVASQLGTAKQSLNFAELNSKIMNASMAFSSVAIAMSMFGNNLGPAGDAIFQLSNALFALSAITQLVNAEKVKEFAITKGAALKNGLATIASGGFRSSIKNLGAMFKNLFTASSGLTSGFMKFIPYIGLAIAVFEGFKFFNKAQNDAKASVDGMSQSAFLAGEKLQAIADLTGFGLSRNPADYGAIFDTGQTGVSQQNIQQSSEISESDSFKQAIEEGGQFYDILQSIKNSSVEDVGTRLTSLMNQMIALAPEDVDVNSVKATMLAIADAAGKTGISLGPVLLPTGPSSELLKNVDAVIADIDAKVQQTNAKFAPSPTASNQSPTVNVAGGQDTGAAEAEGARIASVLETLKSAFISGNITFDQYIAKSNQALAALKGFEGPLQGIAENKIMESFNIPQEVIDGLSTTESKLQAIQLAQIAAPGEKIDYSLLQTVEAGKKVGATAEEIRYAAIAQQKLNLVYKNAESAVKKLSVGLDATAEAVSYEEFELQAAALKEVSEKSQILLGVSNASADAKISEAQARALLTDEIWKEKFAQAQLLDAQTGTNANTEELIRQYQAYQSALAGSNLDDELAKSREQNQVYEWLVDNGQTSADAVKIIGDQTSYAAAMAAMANGTYDEFIAKLEELESISSKFNTGGGGGGVVETTPFEDAIDQLQKQREEIINNKKAYDGLRKSGMDVGQAFEIASDPIIAAALASEKVGSKKWNQLYKEITAVDNMMRKQGIQNLIKMQAEDIQLKSQFSKIVPDLVKIGMTSEQINTILSNPDLAKRFIKDLKDGKLNAQDTLNYIKQIKTMKAIELKITLSTPEGILSELGGAMGEINRAFTALEKQVDIDFASGLNASGKNPLLLNVEKLRADVEKYQEEINGLQDQADDYQYYLDDLQEKEDEINKVYDDREEALDRIAKANQEVADSQKAQLSIANALSQGDIAAAAQAVQEQQAAQAQRAQDKQRELLSASRESALAALTAKNGMTRAQLEEKINDLKKQILDKERDYLEPAQKALEKGEKARDAAKAQLDYLGKTKSAWEEQENAIELAILTADAYKKKIEEIITKIKEAATEYAKIGGGAPAASTPPAPPAKTSVFQAEGVTVLDRDVAAKAAVGAVKSGKATDPLDFANQVRDTVLANRNLVREGNLSNAQKDKLIKENIKLMQSTGLKFSMGGMVPKYFAAGGFARGTDTVPAMLTPGEFVMKKYAVQSFGADRLKAINNGTYKGDSMYNYEVNVNVQTDANPDQIARAVMTQIRQIDSQRIRGNRF